MKYIRRAIAIILAAMFIAAVAIGLSVIFAVRNINVATISYSSSATGSDGFSNSVTSVKSGLSSLTGKNIIGLEEEDISSLVPQEGYAGFVSAEILYPCTINVTLEERLEVFTILSEKGDYLVYDEQGLYITSKAENVNNLDGCPNILVDCGDAEVTEIAEIAYLIKKEFGGLRSVIHSISVVENISSYSYLTIKLQCGTSLVLANYTEYTAEKIAALHTEFNTLEDYEKAEGTISCYSGSSGLYIIKGD